jgi:predicted nucleic acid-binding protein
MNGGFVVVDTNVFSAALSHRALANDYAKHLSGRRLIVSFQTVAEMRFGGLAAGWGQKRMREMEKAIAKAATIPPHDQLATEWADLRLECRLAGHGLAGKAHMADLWIAATARLLGAPLVTHDRIFLGAPGLAVISELATPP